MYVCIAGGTGIIPFLDLFSLTYRFIIDKISRENFNYNGNNLFEENFDFIKPEFKLKIFASYSGESFKIMDNYLQDLNSICKRFNIETFSYEINFDSNKLDSLSVIKFLQENKEKLKKIYFSGSIGFMDSLKNKIIENNPIFKKNIFYV